MNQREIKFRQLVKKGQWHYWGFLETDRYKGFITPLTSTGDKYQIPESSQFTGLKDKNGKEIYERDIVKMIDSPSNWTFKGDEKETLWEVVFENGMFIPKNGETYYNDFEDCYGEEIFLGNNWSYYEVIGNIYENPELLS